MVQFYGGRSFPDGKIIAAGGIDGYVSLIRLTSDLELDSTFGSGGFAKSNDGCKSIHGSGPNK